VTEKEFSVVLTEAAAAQIRTFAAQDGTDLSTAGVRVALLPGGCSGFKYIITIEERPAAEDTVFVSCGVRIFVDDFSSQYLNGTIIDFVREDMQSGFKFNNPNAKGGCGCGQSEEF